VVWGKTVALLRYQFKKSIVKQLVRKITAVDGTTKPLPPFLSWRRSGYLRRTFVGSYDELVVLKDIRGVSFCEHHRSPVIGRAHVGYLPTNRVVGISKLARVVHGFTRRLQIQEKLTAEIAEAIQNILQPQGVGVMIEAEHSCMTLRGVNTTGSALTTSRSRRHSR
jgi:GTP cyclohydrolase I